MQPQETHQGEGEPDHQEPGADQPCSPKDGPLRRLRREINSLRTQYEEYLVDKDVELVKLQEHCDAQQRAIQTLVTTVDRRAKLDAALSTEMDALEQKCTHQEAQLAAAQLLTEASVEALGTSRKHNLALLDEKAAVGRVLKVAITRAQELTTERDDCLENIIAQKAVMVQDDMLIGDLRKMLVQINEVTLGINDVFRKYQDGVTVEGLLIKLHADGGSSVNGAVVMPADLDTFPKRKSRRRKRKKRGTTKVVWCS